MRKFLPQNAGSISFELVGVVLRRVCWRHRDKKVNVVGQDFQSLHFYIQHGCLLQKEFAQTLGNSIHQDRLPIFRTPDQMQTQVKDAACILAVPRFRHASMILQILGFCQLSNERRAGFGKADDASSAA